MKSHRSQMSNDTSESLHTGAYDYDVVIVGGGPAGSTVATLLSRWGRKVLILEKEHFPRHHIGESLLAGTTTLMRQLGVYEKVEQAGFLHKFGATYIWGKSQEPWSIFFSEVGGEERYSFQVERDRYDKILLDHSRDMGTTVMEGCRVTGFVRAARSVVEVQYLDEKQVSRTVSCRFCVDASGQSALVGSAKKLRNFNQALRNFALYSYFRGGKSAVELVPDLQDKDKGNIFVVAMEKGWIWYIPLSSGRHSVGVVTHASLAKELNKENRYKFYRECLDATPQIKYLLSEAEIETTSLYTQSDWSYICDSFTGPGYLLVGDAACFVDPILSTGVDLAMEGAFKAAISINTVLHRPELTEQAMRWYEEEYKTKAGHFLQMAEHWYHGHRTRDDWFWTAKHLVEPDSNLSIRQAFIVLTGGFTTGSGDEDLPALQPFGGFRPFQLRTIYANLCNELAENAPATAKRPGRPAASPTDASVANVEESFPRLQRDMRYRHHMLEQDDHLVPIIQIIYEIEGIPTTRLVLPAAALPLLERIDGTRSVRAIADEIAGQFVDGQSDPAHGREKLLTLVRELYKQHVVESVAE
jgi:flavin-dependent dehydrogenase